MAGGSEVIGPKHAYFNDKYRNVVQLGMFLTEGSVDGAEGNAEQRLSFSDTDFDEEVAAAIMGDIGSGDCMTFKGQSRTDFSVL